jgi:DNA-binding cell septation regulator SpoVG
LVIKFKRRKNMGLKVRITRMFPYDGEHTKAFVGAKVQISGRVFGYNELTLVKKKEGNGLFLGLPSRPGRQEGEYHDICYMDPNTRKDIEKVAIAEYEKKIKESAQVPIEANQGVREERRKVKR